MWLYTNFKSFTGKSLNGSPSHSLLDPLMVRMEKDINAIKQKLSTASEVGSKTNDMEMREVLLESQVGSIQHFHERVEPLEVRVQGLIAGEERRNYEVMDLRRHVDALTPLEPVVPNLVDMDGTVSALTTQVQLLDEEVECLKRENNSISSVRREVSEVKLDITRLCASLETMHSAHDCAETCSCRGAISMVEHELLQMRGEGTRLSSSLDELQSQITRVELDMDSVRMKAGVHTAHGPDCSIICSCRVDIARHEAELQRIGLALDELQDCLDSVVDSVGSSDQFSSFASDLASMHSQLDAHFSLSSQSFGVAVQGGGS